VCGLEEAVVGGGVAHDQLASHIHLDGGEAADDRLTFAAVVSGMLLGVGQVKHDVPTLVEDDPPTADLSRQPVGQHLDLVGADQRPHSVGVAHDQLDPASHPGGMVERDAVSLIDLHALLSLGFPCEANVKKSLHQSIISYFLHNVKYILIIWLKLRKKNNSNNFLSFSQ